jgi:hypothetical protein
VTVEAALAVCAVAARILEGSRGRGDAHEHRVAASMAQARAAALRRATACSRRRSCDGQGRMAGELDGTFWGCSIGGRAGVMEARAWRQQAGRVAARRARAGAEERSPVLAG